MELIDIIGENYNGSTIILDSFQKANSVINNPQYQNIICSISGGADSDLILDICHKVDENNKIKYVWFNTGIEYQATKDHIEYLNQKYNIEIEKTKPIKTIPQTCKEYGQPFLSKFVSEALSALQNHNFTWVDEPYEILSEQYPKITGYIKWWCNRYEKRPGYERLPKQFNIEYNRWLKEFIIQNPPTFKISKKCCDYAKKKVSKQLMEDYNADLMITGIRKNEKGIRAKAYKNCFNTKDDKSFYRPIFWYDNDTKKEYEDTYGILHSKCYTEYGFTRTGCAGCPYNINLESDLEKIKTYEPNLYIAVNNIFKESYEYTKAYRKSQHKMNLKYK